MAARYRACIRSAHLTEQAFAVHQLCVQQRGTGRATDRVVAENAKFEIKYGAWAHGSNDDGHSLTAVTIQTRLRPLHMRFQQHDRARS